MFFSLALLSLQAAAALPGDTIVCRQVMPIGHRIAQRVCRPQKEWDRSERAIRARLELDRSDALVH